MRTPTFPEPPRSDDAEEEGVAAPAPPPPLEETIRALRQGPVRATDVARLSDLGREDGRLLAREWPTLPEATRVAIVRAMDELAEERVELTFGRALRVALDDEAAAVRQLAVAALWEDEREDLLERMLDLVERDPSQDVRAAAARGLGRFAERAAAGDLDEAVARRLRSTLAALAEDETVPYGVRRGALEAVGVFGREERVGELIRDAYEGDDEGLRASALYAMGRSLDTGWFGTLIDELQSPEAELRYEAARACGTLGDDRAVPELGQAARDGDVEVRQAAIAALGQVGGRGAVRVLRALAEEADEVDAETIEAAIEEALTVAEPVRGER